MRKLAHIEEIKELRPIPNADNIEVAVILGWECVVKKGEFQEGEKVIYVEVDSILPDKPEYEFLRDRKFRIKTIKLRGQISQGLVLPLFSLGNSKFNFVGKDVTDILGIVKYESPEEKEVDVRLKNPIVKFLSKYKWFRKLFLQSGRGGFPSWISKTDEERIQNMPHVLTENRDTEFCITEKLDGSSATYYLRKNGTRFGKQLYEFGVCSRNLKKNKPDNSIWWKVARQYNIETLLKNIIADDEFVIVQGEIVGSGVQGNKYKLNGLHFFVFNVVLSNHVCSYSDMSILLSDSEVLLVPILFPSTYIPDNVEDMVKLSYGTSALNKDVLREGIVVRNYPQKISFKAINPEFLLKNGE